MNGAYGFIGRFYWAGHSIKYAGAGIAIMSLLQEDIRGAAIAGLVALLGEALVDTSKHSQINALIEDVGSIERGIKTREELERTKRYDSLENVGRHT